MIIIEKYLKGLCHETTVQNSIWNFMTVGVVLGLIQTKCKTYHVYKIKKIRNISVNVGWFSMVLMKEMLIFPWIGYSMGLIRILRKFLAMSHLHFTLLYSSNPGFHIQILYAVHNNGIL